MIVGQVTGRHPVVSLSVSGPDRRGTADFILDTGFAGYLTLPPDAIARLNLMYVGVQPSSLADHCRTLLSIYRVMVRWDAEDREIDVLELDGAPLLGMALLPGLRHTHSSRGRRPYHD